MEEQKVERFNLIERIGQIRKDAIRNASWVKAEDQVRSIGYLQDGVKVVLAPDYTEIVLNDKELELSINLGVVTPDVEIKIDGENIITYFRETNIPIYSDEHIAMYPEGGIEIEQNPSIKVTEILERMYAEATPEEKARIEKAKKLYMKFEELSKKEVIKTRKDKSLSIKGKGR